VPDLPAWWRALATIFAVEGLVFEICRCLPVAFRLPVAWLLAAQLVLMAMVFRAVRAFVDGRPSNWDFLAVASVAGFFAAFRLTVDKVGTFTTPDVAPSCNVSVLVQWQEPSSSWAGLALSASPT
jgi:hypothetical protein